MESLRFTTIRLGLVGLEVGGQVIESDVRILMGSDGGYRVLAGELSEPLPSVEQAVLRVEGEPVPSDVSRVVGEITARFGAAPPLDLSYAGGEAIVSDDTRA